MSGCCVIVKEKLPVDSTSSQEEAKHFIENDVSKQDKLLLVPMSPGRTLRTFTRKKLLILDLNGVLVDIDNFQLNYPKPDTSVAGKAVYKRPFCDDFLKFCFERFHVGVWSSRKKKNLHAVLNFVMGDHKKNLLFCWDQSNCTVTGFSTVDNRHKPLFLKEVKKLWDKEEPDLPWEKGEFTPSNTLLLDDSPEKALLNPDYTAIFPWTYHFKDDYDNSLGPGGDLRVYLEGLAKSDNIPLYVQEHPFGQCAITRANPSWSYYCNVITAVNSSMAAS